VDLKVIRKIPTSIYIHTGPNTDIKIIYIQFYF